MTREDLSSRYFEWLCGIVFDGRYLKGRSYSKLFELLHSVDFEVVIGMDQNRAEDGIDLRYRFGDEQGYIQPMIASLIDNVPCSVLEMMVALSFQCENTMSDPEEGNRLSKWFWTMIDNSAFAASTSETNAANSASSAAGSASAASTSESNAAASADNAEESANMAKMYAQQAKDTDISNLINQLAGYKITTKMEDSDGNYVTDANGDYIETVVLLANPDDLLSILERVVALEKAVYEK